MEKKKGDGSAVYTIAHSAKVHAVAIWGGVVVSADEGKIVCAHRLPPEGVDHANDPLVPHFEPLVAHDGPIYGLAVSYLYFYHYLLLLPSIYSTCEPEINGKGTCDELSDAFRISLGNNTYLFVLK